ncbi:carotenoid oxygenase family protein [Photobacterium sp. GJ3]|uniref:carotenoid oxygenase family protein n=1 Tax=Photobacterium sp. GJ3 TaxID=2829502 RepID=UPI001B8C8BFB|nr:carotenoid oxygenase family protein [Photobacterium sp. GJ3]QUJ68414.1 carotenoid oxygenase family protein [Photobacterium sp. GJ3]
MKRRSFLKGLAGVAMTPVSRYAFPSPVSTSFPQSIMDAHLTDQSGELSLLYGQLPGDMFGHVFFAEGIPLEEGHFTPSGRGALTRIDFQPNGTPQFTRKMIQTPSVLMQQSIDSWPDRFRLLGGMVHYSPTMGFVNTCNTAPNYMGNNRFALSFEGGVPYEFDAMSLELITPIGHYDEWKSSLPPFIDALTPEKWLFPQVRTTGHPYFDLETQVCFTINYGGNLGNIGTAEGFVDLIRWDQQGALKHWQVVGRDGRPAFIAATAHSLGVTRHHILIFETAAQVEPLRMMGIRSVAPQQHRTPVWIIRKKDLKAGNTQVVADYLELNFDTSDVMCNYDDHDDEITLYGQYLGAMDKSEPQYHWERCQFGGRVSARIAGYPAAPVDVGGLTRTRIQVKPDRVREIPTDFRLLRDDQLFWDMNDPAYQGHFQFPETFEHIYWAAVGYRPEHVVKRVADAYSQYPNRFYTNDTLPQETRPSALVHLDCNTMTLTDAYQFPEDCVMRTPQFMSRPGASSQQDGYVFTAVVRQQPTQGIGNGKEIWLFDAQNLAQGPMAILGHPALNFATTNHALWVPEIGPRPDNSYRAEVGDFFRNRADAHSRAVREVIETQILPRFG